MTIQTTQISKADIDTILVKREGHFSDMKGAAIKPAKLSRTISAFANADGGEI